jgi:hypothetical protein
MSVCRLKGGFYLISARVVSMYRAKRLLMKLLFRRKRPTKDIYSLSSQNESPTPVVSFIDIGIDFAETAMRNNSKAERDARNLSRDTGSVLKHLKPYQ